MSGPPPPPPSAAAAGGLCSNAPGGCCRGPNPNPWFAQPVGHKPVNQLRRPAGLPQRHCSPHAPSTPSWSRPTASSPRPAGSRAVQQSKVLPACPGLLPARTRRPPCLMLTSRLPHMPPCSAEPNDDHCTAGGGAGGSASALWRPAALCPCRTSSRRSSRPAEHTRALRPTSRCLPCLECRP